MTAAAAPAAQDQPEPRPSLRQVLWSMLRGCGVVAALVTLYYVLPLDHSSMAVAATVLLTGLAGFAGLVAVQVRAILRSRYPGLRALEALATSIPFFLLLFAAAYVTLAAQSPGSFSSSLSHTNGIYFTVTVFATVGFGDITAKSEAAQLLVTAQMLADLAVFGLVIKVILEAVRRGRLRRSTAATAPGRGEER
ncbi:potassium channel family protein [Streptomyces sp. NPDC004667]|uniref:potassium channel family protein n=1 Tax=Streptomyces sp. NPDC004667 TaxID=3154285 RepID=UPI0033A76D23